MTSPDTEATADRPAHPPSHRGLGLLGYLFTVLALGGTLAFLAIAPTYDVAVEVRSGEDIVRVEATVVCWSVLSGGEWGQLRALGDDQVSESTWTTSPGCWPGAASCGTRRSGERCWPPWPGCCGRWRSRRRWGGRPAAVPHRRRNACDLGNRAWTDPICPGSGGR